MRLLPMRKILVIQKIGARLCASYVDAYHLY